MEGHAIVRSSRPIPANGLETLNKINFVVSGRQGERFPRNLSRVDMDFGVGRREVTLELEGISVVRTSTN